MKCFSCFFVACEIFAECGSGEFWKPRFVLYVNKICIFNNSKPVPFVTLHNLDFALLRELSENAKNSCKKQRVVIYC